MVDTQGGPLTVLFLRLCSHGTGRIFHRLKDLIGLFVHSETVQYFRTEMTNQDEF